MAIFCSFLRGSAFPAIKLGYQLFNIESNNISAQLYFAGIRFLISGLLLVGFYYLPRKKGEKSQSLKSLNFDQWKKIVVLALIQTFFHYYFHYQGLSITSGAKASIINSLTVFFAFILSHFIFTNDQISLKKILGLVAGIIAVILVNWTPQLGYSFKFYGEGFLIIASFFASLGSVYSKRASNSVQPILLAGLQLFIGGTLLLIVSFFLGVTVPESNILGYSLLLYLSLLSALVLSIWTTLIKHNKVTSITVYYFLNPIFGSLLSAIILNESIFNASFLISAATVAVGIYLVNK